MAIYKKLFEIRKAIGPLTKSATAKLPKYSYDFMPLDVLLDQLDPLLEEHNILLVFGNDADKVDVQLIDLEDDSSIHASITFVPDSDFQEVGKQLTYLRRYALVGLLGKTFEKDDDGASSSRVKGTAAYQKRSAAPEAPGTTAPGGYVSRRRSGVK